MCRLLALIAVLKFNIAVVAAGNAWIVYLLRQPCGSTRIGGCLLLKAPAIRMCYLVPSGAAYWMMTSIRNIISLVLSMNSICHLCQHQLIQRYNLGRHSSVCTETPFNTCTDSSLSCNRSTVHPKPVVRSIRCSIQATRLTLIT